MKRKKLGEVLQERGKISPTDLARVVQEQQGKVIRLGELMLKRGLVDKADLATALEEVTRVRYVDLQELTPDLEMLRLIPAGVAQRCLALPLRRENGKLVVVLAEPQNLSVISELRFTAGMEIEPRLGFAGEIQVAIEQWYGKVQLGKAEKRAADVPVEKESETPEMEFISSSTRQANREAMVEVQAELSHRRTPAVRLVSEVILTAFEKQASDIHIEPQADDTVVRIRIDGILRDLKRAPRGLQNALISRVKILSDMDISERRMPQDGRFLVKMKGQKLDLRVSTLPTQYGEKVVMRLLVPDTPLKGFADLGLDEEVRVGLERILELTQGMLLVTGPTGSGKSTTLYAALNYVRRPTVNIITVEDPIEYALAGVNQVQVNSKAGLTFASSLRSILRQDPNVIMVGEIRDKETAEIAMKAAQTGHLVLSTLHTNDSISAVTRLIDLGVPGFMIAASLAGVIAQRLVRRLCACHEEHGMTSELIARLLAIGVADPPEKVGVAVGCTACDHTGYRGRVGIYELLVFDEAMKMTVASGGQMDEIRSLARVNGMKRMQADALEKIGWCLTSVDEVLRVIPFEPLSAADCGRCGRSLLTEFRYCPHCGSARERSTGPGPRTAEPVREGVLRA